MNWLDWLILAILIWSAWQGLRHGLLIGLANTAGLLIGLLVAYRYYQTLAEYLSVHWQAEELLLPLARPLQNLWPSTGNLLPAEQLAQVISYTILQAGLFLALFIAVSWLINLAGRLLTSVADFALLGPFNRLGGVLLGFAKGVLIVLVILAVLAPFQQQNPFSEQPALNSGWSFLQGKSFEESHLLVYFVPLIDLFKKTVPAGIPYENIWPEQVIRI